jgi:tRNA threonylcarbamoyladenosine biosynthesis protein TsaB
MKILALETSCEQGSIALLVDGRVEARMLDGHANHSEYIIPELNALLGEAGVRLRDLDAIAFGSGPGAFTGLRLACAVGQGLALGSGKALAPVCSLAALACQAGEGQVLVATDARMNEVYFAAYRRCGDQVAELRAPRCLPAAQIKPLPDGPWQGIGSAFAAYPELAQQWGAASCSLQPAAVPLAADVARLAQAMVTAGKLVAPEMAAPLYVRDKVAFTTAERLARGGKA